MKVDVSDDNGGTWVALGGYYALVPLITPLTVKRVPYVTGWGGALVLSNDWTLGVAYNQLVTGTTRDPGQALIEACVGEFLTAATLTVRWYDRNGLAEAYQGVAAVSTAKAATGVAELDRVTALFTGDGELLKIANPLP
jgi:hypothetical protein